MTAGSRLKLGLGELVAMVAGLMSLNALAIDIMLPALPDMGDELAVSDPNHRQYVVIAYVLGMGAAQLLFGPASDRFGRRRPLLLSLLGYSALGLVCIFADTFEVLVVARALQGVAAAGARVISLSIVRDAYAGSRMARVMSLAMMVFMAIPMLAPNLGQAVLFVASWRWIFVVLVVFGVAMAAWIGLRLTATLPPEMRRPLRPRALLEAYSLVFSTRMTCGYLVASGVVFGALFSFIASSEQLYGETFDRKSTFTLYFATVAGSMAVASFLNSRLVERFGMRRLSHGALVAFVAINLAQVVLTRAGVGGFWLFHGSMMASFFCVSFMGANFNAIAMEPLGHVAGTASAAIGFAGTMLAGMLGAFVGQQYDGSAGPIGVGFLALGITALVVVLVTERGRLLRDDAAVGVSP